jgi:UDP-N-acetylmuramoyl-L-alanyl-D-glutamate--2,6-diaminopimelate ligase
MLTLKDLLINVRSSEILGDAGVSVSGLSIDSRKVEPGTVFIALPGTAVDGHDYISRAIQSGAAAVVCERMPADRPDGVCFVRVASCALAAGQMADAFYGNPSASMQVVGVTGTNGKTTTATLLYNLFTKLGHRCGLISTVQNHIGEAIETATHTTPDAVSVQRLLGRMRDAGCSHVFMEVSSHAVHQRRIEGIRFVGGVFTNITHDHLDYHKTFDEYIRVKKQFFDGLPAEAFALTNLDDRRGSVMLQNTVANKVTYSLRVPATFKGKVLENNLTGLILDINGREVHCRLIGSFNAYNLLAVYGVGIQLGVEQDELLTAISDLQGAAGRFEVYRSTKDGLLGIVDYAHTPDALINVLATINQLRTGNQQVITVIGCGGDRDTTKRPVMAEVAAEHSSKAILTSDNPRSENPEAILNDMEAGLNVTQRRKTLRITDRREAIRTAVTLAQHGDIILVAGKGHETYQEIAGVRQHFDDRETLTQIFQQQDR